MERQPKTSIFIRRRSNFVFRSLAPNTTQHTDQTEQKEEEKKLKHPTSISGTEEILYHRRVTWNQQQPIDKPIEIQRPKMLFNV